MSKLLGLENVISIEVYYQIPDVSTKMILENCLYKIDDPNEISEIVHHLKPKRSFSRIARKATNWLVFRFKDNTCIITDMVAERKEMRVTTENGVQEYRINKKALDLLCQHIQNARPLYENTFRQNEMSKKYRCIGQ